MWVAFISIFRHTWDSGSSRWRNEARGGVQGQHLSVTVPGHSGRSPVVTHLCQSKGLLGKHGWVRGALRRGTKGRRTLSLVQRSEDWTCQISESSGAFRQPGAAFYTELLPLASLPVPVPSSLLEAPPLSAEECSLGQGAGGLLNLQYLIAPHCLLSTDSLTA